MNLDEVRVKINDINDQMLALFKERMELSKDVAAAKKEMNKAIYDAKRERDIREMQVLTLIYMRVVYSKHYSA